MDRIRSCACGFAMQENAGLLDLRIVDLASDRLVEWELQGTQIVFGDATPLRVLTTDGFAGGTGVVDDHQDVGAGVGRGGPRDG